MILDLSRKSEIRNTIIMNVIFSEDLKFSYLPDKTVYLMPHPNPTSKHILSNGIYEKDLINWAKNNYKDSKKIFIDIGAHMGTYSIKLAPYFSHTYSFEAQKNTFYCLAGGIALNGLSDKITAHHYALTNPDQAGKILNLKIISPDGGGSSIKNLSNNTNPIREEKVKTKTLDQFKLENIGLIKIDVEGAEIDVLKGAVKTLRESGYPPILFEAWSDSWFDQEREKLMDYVKSLKYNIRKVYKDNMYLATIT